MLPAAGYFRVSHEEQLEGYSLDAQERLYERWLEQTGHVDAGRYRDEGRSAFRDPLKRPGFQRLLADVRGGRIRIVWVAFSSRFFRDSSQSDELLDEFDRLGVQYVVGNMVIDRSTAFGWGAYTINAVFDEYYSRFVSEQTRKSLKEKAEAGRWVGPVPLGYCKDADGELVPSEDAPAIQLAFELYASGAYSYTTIADELNRRGYRTLGWRTGQRGRFGRESVRTILGNRAYIGEVSCSGQTYPGRHQPLVSVELFEAVQRIRVRRTTEVTSPRSLAPSDGVLIGIVYCESCGRRLWHHFGNRDGRGRYYRCSGIPARLCQAPMVRASVLEDQLLSLIGSLRIPPALADEVVSEAERLISRTPRPEQVDAQQVQQKLKRLARVYADGLIDDAEYERERAALQALLVEAPSLALVRFEQARAAALLADLPTLLARATAQERRAVVGSLFERVWVQERRLNALTPRAEVYPLMASIARVVIGVTDGARTRNPLIHSQVLCH